MNKKKIEKPREFTDSQAEAFTRYLTQTKKRRRTLADAILETKWGQNVFKRWLREYKKSWLAR